MKITYKGDYALKAILEMSLKYNKKLVTIHELAERADIPFKFLEQVLLELKKGGFVESKRGKEGGYFLTRPPNEITLGEVVRFIEGPIEPIPCANADIVYKGCKDVYECVFKSIWVDVAKSISEIIDNVTFQDLCSKVSKGGQVLNYNI